VYTLIKVEIPEPVYYEELRHAHAIGVSTSPSIMKNKTTERIIFFITKKKHQWREHSETLRNKQVQVFPLLSTDTLENYQKEKPYLRPALRLTTMMMTMMMMMMMRLMTEYYC